MKAVVYNNAEGLGVLEYKDVPDPSVRSDDVLIEVEAISIEKGDVSDRRQSAPPDLSWTVGLAAAGVVRAVGSCIENRKVGDRVAAFDVQGSHAELWAVPATRTWLLPDQVASKDAAVMTMSFGTANHCLFVRCGLLRGETVLIQAAAGGLGIAAVQLAVLAGANVLAVASGALRCKMLYALGAYHVIDRTTCDVVSEVLRVTGNRGVDVALDPNETTLRDSMAVLAPEGRLVFVGSAGSTAIEVDLRKSMQANQTLFGVSMGAVLEKPKVWSTVDSLFKQLATQRIKVLIDRTFPLSDAAIAHRYAENTASFGPVVLTP
ncbi:zinc-binding alcohol dehydrogenase family protein [Acidovorax sp. Root219]|uniref:quinone oxidoreductase family protein n=1 Tax=Acidovorax sp. Root219 TaxID=1736493 RepID=UPI0009E9AF27|nr:zinc-binding alcohol dehydrogenase family protein [Acidovorax sp. Root219]